MPVYPDALLVDPHEPFSLRAVQPDPQSADDFARYLLFDGGDVGEFTLGPEPMVRQIGLIYRKDKALSKAALGSSK
jgi:hypothetical protein